MANPLSMFAKVWNKEESKKLISSIQEKYSVEENVKEQDQEQKQPDALKPVSTSYKEEPVTKNADTIHEQDNYEELCCEYCNRQFTTILDTTVHEKTCLAKNVKSRHVKQTTMKTPQTCHICGNTGHLPVHCKVTHFEKEH
jgi:hypothetical protein